MFGLSESYFFNKISKLLGLIGLVALLAISTNARAVPIIPGDIDGSGLFSVGAGSISVELFDIADTVGGSEFGFFSYDDPATLVPIFDGTDLAGEFALIDFTNGFVADTEDAAIQSIFTPAPTVIGFYLSVPTLPTLFSVADMNGGIDIMAATIPAPGSIGINFIVSGTILSWHVLTDLTPYSAVPEPSTLILMLGGMILMVGSRIKKSI